MVVGEYEIFFKHRCSQIHIHATITQMQVNVLAAQKICSGQMIEIPRVNPKTISC